jgi:hypothetical protein
MYVSATYVSEALADTVGRGRAVVLIYRDRSFCHCDQTGTGMGVPPTLAPGLEGVLGDVEVGVAFHPRDEELIRQVACTHQVEQAGWEVACRHGDKRLVLVSPHEGVARAETGLNAVRTASAGAMRSGTIRIF